MGEMKFNNQAGGAKLKAKGVDQLEAQSVKLKAVMIFE